MSVEDQIRSALHDGARGLSVAGRGPGAARDRARRLERRRRAAVPALLTTTVLAGAGAVAWVQSGPRGTAGIDAAAPGHALDADAFEWQPADIGFGSYASTARADDGTYYVLSTAPGTRYEDHPDGAVPQAIYRSSDGVHWEMTPVEGKPWIRSIAARGNGLYAIGTAPAAGGGIATQAAYSRDGGVSWTAADLVSTARTPTADVPLHSTTPEVSFAAGDAGLVAIVQRRYWVDPNEVLAAAELADAPAVEATAAGLVVSKMKVPEECSSADSREVRVPSTTAPSSDPPAPDAVATGCEITAEGVRTIPWSDLGIESMESLTVTEVFVSGDGAAWESLGDTMGAGAGRVASLVATPDGYFAGVEGLYSMMSDSAPLTSFHSVDGRTWAPVETDLPGGVVHLGAVGNRLVAVGFGGTTVYTSPDGGSTWNGTALAPLVDPDGEYGDLWITGFDSGPLGTALLVSAMAPGPEPTGGATYLVMSGDGETWTASRLDGRLSSGSERLWGGSVTVGNDSVSVTVGISSGSGADVTSEARTFLGTPRR